MFIKVCRKNYFKNNLFNEAHMHSTNEMDKLLIRNA